MITPPSFATISRAAACATRKAALTLSPSNRSRVSSSTSRKGCGRLMPALLTRMSRRSRPAKASRTESGRVTSSTTGCALPPADLIAPATSSRSLLVRLTSTRSAPAAASASAAARPMPRPAPVTSAILPSTRNALSADFTGVGFQQVPRRGSGFFLPARVKLSEPCPEAVRVGGVDLHPPARQLLGPGCVHLLDVVALQQRIFLGIALDNLLHCAREGTPGRLIGQQREARPPMCGEAQIRLHLIELERQHDAERIALPVVIARFQRIVHLAERDITGLRAERREEVVR